MDDREIARRALDFRSRAKSYCMLVIPAYMPWSQRKLKEGVSDALIAHLDATSMELLPEEVQSVSEAVFEEMLAELKLAIQEYE